MSGFFCFAVSQFFLLVKEPWLNINQPNLNTYRLFYQLERRRKSAKIKTMPFSLKIFKKERILILLFLFVLAFYAFNQISDTNDIWYRLKSGEYILENKTILKTDVFSYSAFGQKWIQHDWLSAVIFSSVFKIFHSFWLLIIFPAFFCFITYWLVLKHSLYRGSNFYLCLLLIFPFSFLTLELWVARPQIFSYFLLALLLFLLEKLRREGKTKILYFLPLLFLLWANLHASVVLGLGIFAFYAGLMIFSPLLSKFRFLQISESSTVPSRSLRLKTAVSFLLSLAVSFLNPNTYQTLLYFFIISPVAQSLGNMEWRSLLSYLNIFQAKIFLGMMFFVVGFIIWRSIVRRKIDLYDLGLTIVFFVMPFLSIRHIGYFPLAVFPIFINELSRLEVCEKIFSRKEWKTPLSQLLIFFSIILIFVRLFHLPTAPLNEKFLPVKAADFVEKNNIYGPMFNVENGGYLIWRFWPKEKVFFDGRNDVFIGKPSEDYKKIILTQDNWQELIENYKINYFFIWYREPLNNIVGNLVKQLREKLDFRLIYWDDTTLIYLKNNAANQSLIEKYELRLINPYLDPALIPNQFLNEASQELLRALNISPHSDFLLDYGKILMEGVKTK